MNYQMHLRTACLLSALALPSAACSTGAGVESNVSSTGQALHATRDINKDGKSDFVWQNTTASGGPIQAWFMSGTPGTDVPSAGGVNFHDASGELSVPAPWVLAGEGRFGGASGDATDFVFRNLSTGEVQVWLMSATDPMSRVSYAYVTGGSPPTNLLAASTWSLVGVGDIDLDAKPDMLFHDSVTGHLQVWLLGLATGTGTPASVPRIDYHNVTLQTRTGAEVVLPAPWRVGALNCDKGTDVSCDIYVQNPSTGVVQVWTMDQWVQTAVTTVLPVVGTSAADPWVLTGNAQLDGDLNGYLDLVFYNKTTGKLMTWFMSGPAVSNQFGMFHQNGNEVQVFNPWQMMPD